MGISMLGGIVGSILGGIASALAKGLGVIVEALMKLIMTILSPVMDILMRYLVAPLIALVVNLINYVLAILWYNISMFLLGLLDYVQILFKLLAGFKEDNMQLNLKGSKSPDSDLLIQLILSDNVKNIFLAMCIVGVFLLVITTIFQIIKVEYTTEGAKNAKGPILNKAFKGLCNMIMIPALCICGVFIGNRILELLDTATGGGDKTSISGQLFVAAASEAHYSGSDCVVIMASSELVLAATSLVTQIIPITWNSVMAAWGIKDGLNLGAAKTWQDKGITTTEETIENNFKTRAEGFNFYSLENVSTYYDYSRINYLLLIFGACFLIKTLYFTCFGMIVRLYQCGMLFIISPAVIGMTPINESGLGKWRSDFIGSAISAYGVVMAVNIYLVLVSVLLGIEFDFSTSTYYFLGASLMEALLKCIIIIGGAIYIEKFSGQIGGYFGAKDALAQGKDLEKGVKDQAKKAVGTAVQVGKMATGVGGAAISGAKSGAMAAKLASAEKGHGKLSQFNAAVRGGILGGGKGFYKGVGHEIKSGVNGVLDTVDGGFEYVANSMGLKYDNREDRKNKRGIKRDNKELGEIEQSLVYHESMTSHWLGEAEKARRLGNEEDLAMAEANLDYHASQKHDLRGRHAKVMEDKSEREATLEKRDEEKDSQITLAREASRQGRKSFFNEKTFLGQNIAAVKKQVSGYEDAAAKAGGAEVEAAQKALGKIKSDEAEKGANDRNKEWIDHKNEGQMLVLDKIAANVGEVDALKSKNMISDNMKRLDYYQDLRDKAEAVGHNQEARMYDEQLIRSKDAIADRLNISPADIQRGADGKYDVSVEAKHNIEIDKSIYQDILKLARKNMKDGMKQEEAIKQAVKEAVTGMTPQMAKTIQDGFKEILQQFDKGK